MPCSMKYNQSTHKVSECLTAGPAGPRLPVSPPIPAGPSVPAGPPSPRSPWIPAGPYIKRGMEVCSVAVNPLDNATIKWIPTYSLTCTIIISHIYKIMRAHLWSRGSCISWYSAETTVSLVVDDKIFKTHHIFSHVMQVFETWESLYNTNNSFPSSSHTCIPAAPPCPGSPFCPPAPEGPVIPIPPSCPSRPAGPCPPGDPIAPLAPPGPVDP